MNMKPVPVTTRKDIDISLGTKRSLQLMAVDVNTNLKNFIEAELTAMGEKGIAYTALWNEAEALRIQLTELTISK